MKALSLSKSVDGCCAHSENTATIQFAKLQSAVLLKCGQQSRDHNLEPLAADSIRCLGISLVLERVGDVDTRKSIHMHINYELFAEILLDLAATVAAMPAQDVAHRETLADAAKALHRALAAAS
jgi:hypothetical protein